MPGLISDRRARGLRTIILDACRVDLFERQMMRVNPGHVITCWG
jgi:hypothetical protein